jgi:hypothetical protein
MKRTVRNLRWQQRMKYTESCEDIKFWIEKKFTSQNEETIFIDFHLKDRKHFDPHPGNEERQGD